MVLAGLAGISLVSCQPGLPKTETVDYLIDELKPPEGTNPEAVVVLFTVGSSRGYKESVQAVSDAGLETGAKVQFITLNLDDNPGIARQYGVHGTPTFLFFDRDGKLQSTVANAIMTKEQILAQLRRIGVSK
jgi:thioredoxin-like negative regulator of GroEL